MKKRLARNRNEQKCEKRVRQIRLPRLNEADAVVPRELWGTELPVDLNVELPQHTCSDLTWVPEGIAVAVRCLACGGRYSALIDMRPACEAADPQEAVEPNLAVIDSYLQGIWIQEHEGCTQRPRSHHAPGVVHTLLSVVEEATRQMIHEGEPVGLVFHLLDTNGKVYLHHATEPSAQFGSTDRRNDIAAVQFALREAVRVQRIDLLAAAVVAETWMEEVSNGPPGEISEMVCPPSQAPNRLKAPDAPGPRTGYRTAHNDQSMGHARKTSPQWQEERTAAQSLAEAENSKEQ